MLKRIVVITFVLTALLLLFRGSPAYAAAIEGGTEWFRKIFGALAEGRP